MSAKPGYRISSCAASPTYLNASITCMCVTSSGDGINQAIH